MAKIRKLLLCPTCSVPFFDIRRNKTAFRPGLEGCGNCIYAYTNKLASPCHVVTDRCMHAVRNTAPVDRYMVYAKGPGANPLRLGTEPKLSAILDLAAKTL